MKENIEQKETHEIQSKENHDRVASPAKHSSKKEAKSKAKGTKETSSAKASTSKASVESPPPRKGSKAKGKATPRSDTVTIRAEPASTTADESKPRPRPQIIKKSVVVEVPSLPVRFYSFSWLILANLMPSIRIPKR